MTFIWVDYRMEARKYNSYYDTNYRELTAAHVQNLARLHLPTKAFCFSMNCQNLIVRY